MRVRVYSCFTLAAKEIDLSGYAKRILVGVLLGRFRGDALAEDRDSTVTADLAH